MSLDTSHHVCCLHRPSPVLTDRDLELIEVALASAARTCIGADALAEEYADALGRIEGLVDHVEVPAPVVPEKVCLLCGKVCGLSLNEHQGVWE